MAKQKFEKECGDVDGPVVDIFPDDLDEAFQFGRMFGRMLTSGCICWKLKNGGMRFSVATEKSKES